MALEVNGLEMSLESMINATISMRNQAVKEQFSIGVTRMAMDMEEQSGQEILKMMDGAAPVSLDPNLGNMIDISL